MMHVGLDKCGVWLPASENWYDFYLSVVDLAISNGMSVGSHISPAERSDIISGSAEFDLLVYLDSLYYDALDYLCESVPDGYWFEGSETSGLVLYHMDDSGRITG